MPAPVKARLAEHPDPALRYAAAASAADEPPGLLARLAEDPDPLVRSFLTMNENLPAELVARLARDPDPNVRKWLPQHCRNVPQAVRRAVFTDADPNVRRAAVAFWPPPTDLLPALLADPSTRAVAARHSLPTPELARDPDPGVRRTVAAHPELPRCCATCWPRTRTSWSATRSPAARTPRRNCGRNSRQPSHPRIRPRPSSPATATAPAPHRPRPTPLTENQAHALLARAGL
ncbi:hypothetical protein [Kitasatospora purpeofusca]|uniref:hypothetical protein n=1 Tax=Kitasatospora purpeofusca TaxID=67352 RepID=UPI0036581931